jgi:putative ABC transport system ATP-binding protein
MSLVLQNVNLTVPDGPDTLTLLDDVSLRVDQGEVVALTGPSGSGKSTLIAIAALLLEPQSGRITIDDDAATGIADRQRTKLRRDHIGVVFQSANLFPSLTALQQLELVAHIAGRLDGDARTRANELLVTVGLGSRLNARPAQLSGGEQQRVGIARALMSEPTLLLADEPTASLDPERGEAVMDLLVEQATERGTATLIVTHLLGQIAASRTLTIERGRVTELAPAGAS